MTRRDHEPCYTVTYTEPDYGMPESVLLVPPATLGGATCESCGGADAGPDSRTVYEVTRSRGDGSLGVDYGTHLECYLALCVDQSGGSALIALAPTLCPSALEPE